MICVTGASIRHGARSAGRAGGEAAVPGARTGRQGIVPGGSLLREGLRRDTGTT